MDFQLKVGPTTQDARIETARTLCTQGENLIRAGNFEGALQAFSQAADIFPEYARAKNALGVIYVFKGDWNKAAGYFSEAFNLIPDDPVITLNVGKFLERVSKPEEAIKIYQSYLEKKHDQDISQELTRLKTASPIPAVSIQKDMSGKRQIVFIADMSPFIPRVPKFAYGLKQNGWDVVLLHRNALNFDPKKYFVETRQYGSPDEAAELAASYHPLAYHVFSSWYFNTAAAVIRRKPGKIVFDDYDVMAGMVKDDIARRQYPGQLELERFCLENAEGLCCRSLETQYAKRVMGYKYCGKRIFFPDYCFNKKSFIQKKISERLNIANVGNIYINPRSDIDDADNFHLKLSLILSQYKITTYLYHALLTDEILQFLDKILSNNTHIVVKKIGYESLLEEMSQLCHAGLLCAPPSITQKPSEIYNQFKRDLAIGNKIFDYIDAGMPIIMDTESKFLYWLIKRYHKVIDFHAFMSEPPKYIEILRDYLNNNSTELQHSMMTMSICRHIPRLIRFYENI